MLKVPGQLSSIFGYFNSQPALVCYIDYSALFKSYDFSYFCQVCVHMPKNAPVRAKQFPCNHGTNYFTIDLIESKTEALCWSTWKWSISFGILASELINQRENLQNFYKDSFAGTI